MTMLNIEDIRKELGELVDKCDDCIGYSLHKCVEKYVIAHFGRIPYMNQLTDRNFTHSNTNDTDLDTPLELSTYYSDYDEEEYRERTQNIDIDKTLEKILEAYPEAISFNIKNGRIRDSIIFHNEFVYDDGIFYMDSPEIPQKMYDCVVEKDYKPQIRWILRNSRGGIDNRFMEISPKGSIDENYNDDFKPINEKITKLIRDDDSCIIILHGKPGTGKTTYIRNLINSNKDIKFYWIDSSMFNYIDSSEFIQFIATCKNAVFILEDSEDILRSRENSKNPAMQSLLSISDGMLGDSLKLKFICTFNTDLKNIDDAILRKGRMKVKYEFRELKKDKVEYIFRKLGIDDSNAREMSLCDIYNFLDDNGNVERRTSIGFKNY